jgi:hypothetical protein
MHVNRLTVYMKPSTHLLRPVQVLSTLRQFGMPVICHRHGYLELRHTTVLQGDGRSRLAEPCSEDADQP